MLKESLILLFQVLFIINMFFAVTIILFDRKTPGVTWAWLMIVLFIPFLGFIIYFVFGFDGKKYKEFVNKSKYDEQILEKYSKLKLDEFYASSELEKNIVKLNFASSHSKLSTNNEILIYHEGQDKFDNLIKDINNAKDYIHMQYYILRNDDLGRRIINILAKKASENVEVKLLLDGMTSKFIAKRILAPLISSGGKVEMFMSPHFVKINFRNHRKICVIDGNIGYIGGFNIGNEYLGKIKKFGHWRDCHIRIRGNAVKDLELRFIMDWNYSSPNFKIDVSKFYFPKINTNDFSHMQIISSGPDTKWSSIQYLYIKMISEATKSIYIQTPYFIPDDSIFEMLRIASLSGIDVRIMIPAYPDHPFVYWAALSYLGELIESNVKCYKYERGFVHSKLVIVDGKMASVGTANMDIRSLKLNFEINALIYDEKQVEILESQFIEDISDSSIMDYEWYHGLSTTNKIKESLCRLISPLL